MVGLELFAKSIGIDIYQKFADKETLSSVFIEMGSANKKKPFKDGWPCG